MLQYIYIYIKFYIIYVCMYIHNVIFYIILYMGIAICVCKYMIIYILYSRSRLNRFPSLLNVDFTSPTAPIIYIIA